MIPVWVSIPIPILFLLVSAAVILLSRKPIREWLGTFSIDWRAAGFILLQLLIVGIGLDFLSQFLGANDTQSVAALAQNLAVIPLFGIAYILLSAFAEEVMFRGVLYKLAGPFGSALLFGVFHLGYGSGIELLGALLAGIILAHGRMKTKSIYSGLLAHLAYNLVVVFILT